MYFELYELFSRFMQPTRSYGAVPRSAPTCKPIYMCIRRIRSYWRINMSPLSAEAAATRLLKCTAWHGKLLCHAVMLAACMGNAEQNYVHSSVLP